MSSADDTLRMGNEDAAGLPLVISGLDGPHEGPILVVLILIVSQVNRAAASTSDHRVLLFEDHQRG
jgi:hypothetical protein